MNTPNIKRSNILIYAAAFFLTGSFGLYLLQELFYATSNRTLVIIVSILALPGRTLAYSIIHGSLAGAETGFTLVFIYFLTGLFYAFIYLSFQCGKKILIPTSLILAVTILILATGFIFPKQYIEKAGLVTTLQANKIEKNCLGYSNLQSDNTATDGLKISICRGLIY